MTLEIITIPCLQDNYAYLLHDKPSGKVGLVDAPEDGPIRKALSERGWGLDLILITHHHDDHINAVDALRSSFDARVVGAAADRHRLPPLDIEVAEGDVVELGESAGEVLEVSGHTMGHIAYYFAAARAVFTADSLMAMGCGRLFEGTAEKMWDSLSKLSRLPKDTMIYSGHEYTEANARFAASIDGDNPALLDRNARILEARRNGAPTVPSRLDDELATNPFLRATAPEMKANVNMKGAADVDVFAEIRRRKDTF